MFLSLVWDIVTKAKPDNVTTRCVVSGAVATDGCETSIHLAVNHQTLRVLEKFEEMQSCCFLRTQSHTDKIVCVS